MFRQPNFSNLRFNIIQAINPYIQNSSNKCFGKSIISLPNNKVKSTISLPKKLITRHLRLKCLTLKIKNFKFASNLRENF